MSKGRQPDFDIDLAYGEAGESWVHDVVGGATKGEVKRDGLFPSTGNIYVEYQCRGRDGIWRPSGIAETKSELWFHILGDTGAALVMSTARLKDYCRPLVRLGKTAEEKDGSNPTKGVLVNVVDFVASLSPLALAGAKRRQERLAKGSERTCMSCGDTPARMWPVPVDQRARYGNAVPFCRLCEPYVGEPIAA